MPFDCTTPHTPGGGRDPVPTNTTRVLAAISAALSWIGVVSAIWHLTANAVAAISSTHAEADAVLLHALAVMAAVWVHALASPRFFAVAAGRWP